MLCGLLLNSACRDSAMFALGFLGRCPPSCKCALGWATLAIDDWSARFLLFTGHPEWRARQISPDFDGHAGPAEACKEGPQAIGPAAGQASARAVFQGTSGDCAARPR